MPIENELKLLLDRFNKNNVLKDYLQKKNKDTKNRTRPCLECSGRSKNDVVTMVSPSGLTSKRIIGINGELTVSNRGNSASYNVCIRLYPFHAHFNLTDPLQTLLTEITPLTKTLDVSLQPDQSYTIQFKFDQPGGLGKIRVVAVVFDPLADTLLLPSNIGVVIMSQDAALKIARHGPSMSSRQIAIIDPT